MIRTRIDALDEFLGGSLPGGLILDNIRSRRIRQDPSAATGVNGGGRGRTPRGIHRCHRLIQGPRGCCRCAGPPETAALKRIEVFRATSVSEQADALRRLDDGNLGPSGGQRDGSLHLRIPRGARGFRQKPPAHELHEGVVAPSPRHGCVRGCLKYESDMPEIGRLRAWVAPVDLFTHVKMRLSADIRSIPATV